MKKPKRVVVTKKTAWRTIVHACIDKRSGKPRRVVFGRLLARAERRPEERVESMVLLSAREYRRLKFDAIVGQELESAVCMYTHFTGDPPYVGNKGLVRAIKEAGRAHRDVALRAQVKP